MSAENKPYEINIKPSGLATIVVWLMFLAECNSCDDSRENIGRAWSAVSDAAVEATK